MSKCELIELQDLSVNDTIELAAPAARTALPPVNPGQPCSFHVVRLVGDSVSIEAPGCQTGEAGVGHDFQPYSYTHLTWCDLCGEFIWGLYKQSLRCANCSYTCHYRCRPFIQLDCSTDASLLTDQPDFSVDSIETDTNVDDHIDLGKQELSVGDIQQKVKEYNAQINSNLYMMVNKDGFYTGFIKVHFQLVRPISLPPPQSLCSTQEEGQQGRRMKRRTSFYLPKDTAKHLHLSSQTRVQEVIEALLNKFTVVDNPAKFALFERSLCAGPSEKVLSLQTDHCSVDDPTKDGNEQSLARVRSFPGATPFVFTRRSSMFFDEDGDLAHEFYEETIVTKNGRKKAKLKRIQKNLTPQGIIKLDHPCIHVDFPVVLCEA